jgi:tetratricopeptide (TPR) repeat protein
VYQAYYNLGLSYRKKGFYDEAEKYFRKAKNIKNGQGR